MPRKARVTVAGMPHHVIQRGNRRQQVFFNEADRRFYLNMLGSRCRKFGVAVWAYCLMDNHVHLVLVPSTAEALARAVGDTHQYYSRRINGRNGWRGYL